MNRLMLPTLALAVLVVSACRQPEPAESQAAAPATPAAEAPGPAEPAAPADAPADVPAAEPGAAPATTAVNDPEVINFEGFGPAKFGANEEAVRMSWGRPLEAGTPAEGATCYLLFMDPRPEGGRGITFLMEDGKFARYDVDLPLHVAPGDIAVGARADAVRAKFAGRIEEQPHKYEPASLMLVVSPEGGGDARLVFDVGPEGLVRRWHIGVPPQVYYVEGCG
ncbi:hypothetical protein [Arenimonas sp. MALMAid1274]|uniref:hypothetical protein n=1 Tax=Arenimonas sp. MALMAid1274 TaxID=3411630 RepID=UPI003B9F9AD0